MGGLKAETYFLTVLKRGEREKEKEREVASSVVFLLLGGLTP